MITESLKLEKLNRKEALRYLGYSGEKLDKTIEHLIDICEEKVLTSAKPRYVYKVCNIMTTESEINKNHGIMVEGCNLVLTGESIKKHLKGCDMAVLMAVTLSDSIDRLIRITQVEDMAKAVIVDSLSSVAVEQVCDKVEHMIRQAYPDKYQTFRFGIGYGDLSILLQKDFLNALNAPKRIGLNVNASCMLTPTKSVTAIIGLSDNPIEKTARGCQTCNMREQCNIRQKGGHCNG